VKEGQELGSIADLGLDEDVPRAQTSDGLVVGSA